MFNDEDLESKYGLGGSSQDSGRTNNNINYDNSKENSTRINTTFTKKTKETLTEREKEIKSNIANVLSQYAQNDKTILTSNTKQKNETKKEESFIVKMIKGLIVIAILLSVFCIIIALIAKPQIDFEGEQIIEQIKKSEDLYYAKMYKYHYFPKTNYNQTLGIDLSICKFFTYCEVVPNEETGNYEAKLYGATNAFTMTYYYLKSLIIK